MQRLCFVFCVRAVELYYASAQMKFDVSVARTEPLPWIAALGHEATLFVLLLLRRIAYSSTHCACVCCEQMGLWRDCQWCGERCRTMGETDACTHVSAPLACATIVASHPVCFVVLVAQYPDSSLRRPQKPVFAWLCGARASHLSQRPVDGLALRRPD